MVGKLNTKRAWTDAGATCVIGLLICVGAGCAKDRAASGGSAATEEEQQKAAKVQEPTRQDIPPAQQPGRIRPM